MNDQSVFAYQRNISISVYVVQFENLYNVKYPASITYVSLS